MLLDKSYGGIKSISSQSWRKSNSGATDAGNQGSTTLNALALTGPADFRDSQKEEAQNALVVGSSLQPKGHKSEPFCFCLHFTLVSTLSIFVGNLDPNVTEDELKQFFLPLGEIVYVKIPASKGCGFVQFATKTSAEEAIQRMQGQMIGQQVVRISKGRNPTAKQVEGSQEMAAMCGAVPGIKEMDESYNPLAKPDVDK
ncbi:hypothetical protein REPUB_Repub01dG0083600 [Reevesia pubescens]